ncbi:MAG: hypothetical protein KKF44_03400 [Nanoarchaeota archaeon]|nr:hypothetical protein [Nanoarchaeota archaeon]
MGIEIHVRPFTAQEEFDFIELWHERYKTRIEQGYDVIMPDHSDFVKAFNQPYAASNWNSLKKLFIEEIYDADTDEHGHYKEGIAAINKQLEIVQKAIPILEEFRDNWGFHLPEEYTIIVSKYGVTGSYITDENKGIIRLINGEISDYRAKKSPLHELVHIGIENLLVLGFDLTHEEKEGVVDALCSYIFRERKVFPRYMAEKYGDAEIKKYITAKTIDNIPAAVKEYREKNPLKT